MSTNTIYTQVDGLLVRVAEHSCHCDECKLLDAQDFEALRLAHEYLDGKLTFDEWRDLEVGNAVGEKDVAINRFQHAIGAKEGPSALSDAIDWYIYAEWQLDGIIKNEYEFKIILSGLIHGYEVRQRTVHKWHLEEPAAGDQAGGAKL